MTPLWLDAHGRRRPTHACWSCGTEIPIMRYRGEDLARHGWVPLETMRIVHGCGHGAEYLPLPERPGSWLLVPIWEPDTGTNPLRRLEPPGPAGAGNERY